MTRRCLCGLTNVHVMRTAEMLDIHCVVFARGKVPSEEILDEARELGIVVLATEHTTYTACGLMYMAVSAAPTSKQPRSCEGEGHE